MVLLQSVTAVGAGTEQYTVSGIQYPPSAHTIQANITGAPTAVTVTIEARLPESTIWKTLATHVFSAGDLTATSAMFHITGIVAPILRANVTVLTAGTAPTVSVYHTGA